MTATPVASGSVANNAAKQFTTPAGVTGTNSLLVFVGSSLNGDTIAAPGTGTWSEVDPTGDKVITSSGGQLRCFQCLNPASSTAYAWTIGSSRFSIGWVLLDGADLSGGTMVDFAGSLESAAAGTHAPPALGGGGLPTAANELLIDCLMFRQFNPDASGCSPPGSGLTWTELLDFRGNDAGGSGQNVQMAVNYATAGAANTAISTAALNTADPNEPAMVFRVGIKSAAAGGGPVTLAGTGPAAAGLTGALSTARPLTTKGTAAAALTGAVRVSRAVAARAPAAAYATGALRAARPIAGKATAASSASGSLTVTGPSVVALAGTIAAASHAVAAAAASRRLTGRASAAAAFTAALTVGAPYTPAYVCLDGGSTTTGSTESTLTAAGTADGGTTVTGYL